MDSYQTAWNQFVDQSQALLDQQVSTANQHGVKTSGTLLQGNPGVRLCDVAQTWNADLVMVGSRGLFGLQELLMGSVSHYVSRRAPCAVLVNRPKLAKSQPTELCQVVHTAGAT